MSDKLPQSTEVLVKRLRRVAKWLDQMAEQNTLTAQGAAQRKARANTCWQAAARLEELDAPRAGYEAYAKAEGK